MHDALRNGFTQMTLIALTQSLGRLDALEPALKARGFETLRVPLVRTVTLPVNLEPLDACAWWLISSVATVEALEKLGADFSAHRFGAVGRTSAETIRAAGGQVDLIAPEGDAASLAQQFLAQQLNLERADTSEPIGLPLGDRTLSVLNDELTRAGSATRTLCVYSSQSNPWPTGAPQPDLIVLASPTAVQALPQAVATRARLIALGPTTAASIQARGWTCRVAREPSTQALLESMP
jgi:uroporphyrinogen-III synthase